MRSTTGIIVIVIGGCVIAALLHVYVHLQVIQAGYDLAHETHLRHDLGEQNQKLRLELAVRKDPAVIERRAREELHMQPPDPALLRVLHVPAGAPAAMQHAPAALPQVPAAPQQAAPAAPQQAAHAAPQQASAASQHSAGSG